jgi:NAD(P)-dependent dehydrogenase (short-subunit alcohol dehydrogenase family)
LAVEFAGNGITVNTIPPALVDTPMARAAEADGTLPASLDVIGTMLPLKRVGTAEDIAGESSFISTCSSSSRRQPDSEPQQRELKEESYSMGNWTAR